MKQNRIWIHILVLVIYAGLALVTLGPLHPTKEVWGNQTSDVYTHLHVLFWQAQQARQWDFFPFYDELLNYPDGGAVWIADGVGSTAMIPVVWAAGPIAAYNLLILIDILFACWAMFWFIRRATQDGLAAFAAGVVYGLSPYLLAQINNGITENLQAGWLPLFCGLLLELERYSTQVQSKKKTFLFMLGLAIVWWLATVGSHWYYGFYVLLILLAVGSFWIFRPNRGVLWKRMVYTGLVFVLFLLPFLLSYLAFSRHELRFSKSLSMENPASFSPGDCPVGITHSPDCLTGDNYLQKPYLSISALVVVLLGIFSMRKARATRWILILFAGSLLFRALADLPALLFDGEAANAAARFAALQYDGLVRQFPFIGTLSLSYRWALLEYLLIAVALGLVLAQWKPNWKPRTLVLLLIACAAWLEILFVSGAPAPQHRLRIEPKGPVENLKEEQETFAVFDLPLKLTVCNMDRYVTNQLFHGRAVLYSNFPTTYCPFSPTVYHSLAVVRALRQESGPVTAPQAHFSKDPPPVHSDPEVEAIMECFASQELCTTDVQERIQSDLEVLRSLNITRFIVHQDLIDPESNLPRIAQFLFGPPVFKNPDGMIFCLRP